MVPIIPVLFIDDNPEICIVFQLFLEESGEFTVHCCNEGEEALAWLEENQAKVVISDYTMPDMDGIEVIKEIKARFPHMPCIMITGMDDQETATNALTAGADFYQQKAEDLNSLITDLIQKIKVLMRGASAQEALVILNSILNVIDNATNRFLGSEPLEVVLTDILKQLGLAVGADLICIDIKAFPDSPFICRLSDKISDTYENVCLVCMKGSESSSGLTPVNITIDEGPSQASAALTEAGLGRCILIPVLIDERKGWIGLIYADINREISPSIFNALSVAAKVISAGINSHK